MIEKIKAWYERYQRTIYLTGNVVVPFIIGYLLSSSLGFHNWRFWVIIVLVLGYRGTRGKNG